MEIEIMILFKKWQGIATIYLLVISKNIDENSLSINSQLLRKLE